MGGCRRSRDGVFQGNRVAVFQAKRRAEWGMGGSGSGSGR
jgi:hypothetical protein